MKQEADKGKLDKASTFELLQLKQPAQKKQGKTQAKNKDTEMAEANKPEGGAAKKKAKTK